MHTLCALCKSVAPTSRYHGEAKDAKGRLVIEFVCAKCDKDEDKKDTLDTEAISSETKI